jgi:hypothetical protein
LTAQTEVTIDDIQNGAAGLVDTLATALPFNSTIGLNWSDAYIGQLLHILPHMGVGVTVGATQIDGEKLTGLFENFGVVLPSDVATALVLPAAVAEARIGGFILPFDIGVKAAFVPANVSDSISEATDGLNVDYMLVGADFRYALMKGNFLLPKISVGVGFNYMKGGLSKTIGTAQRFEFEDATSTTHWFDMTAPEVGIEWESTVIDFKAQISKSLIIFTPYIGGGLSYAKTNAGYRLNSDVSYDGAQLDDTQIQAIKDKMTEAGITPPDFDSKGIRYFKDESGWIIRAFGGLSVNLIILRLDVTGMYNVTDGSLGGSVGARIQF